MKCQMKPDLRLTPSLWTQVPCVSAFGTEARESENNSPRQAGCRAEAIHPRELSVNGAVIRNSRPLETSGSFSSLMLLLQQNFFFAPREGVSQ